MKRSEAIALIKDVLGGYTPNDEKVANWILEELEKAGMLPPPWTNTTMWLRSTGDYAERNEWEPEDEL